MVGSLGQPKISKSKHLLYTIGWWSNADKAILILGVRGDDLDILHAISESEQQFSIQKKTCNSYRLSAFFRT